MAIVTPGPYSNAALATELNTDPKGIGYPAVFANSDSLANLINTRPEPIAAANQEQIYRAQVLSSDLLAGIVLGEFTALTVATREYCLLLFAPQYVRTGDANVRASLGAIFAAGTTSRTNLLAAAQKDASRAEALWGDGVRVTGTMVAEALGR